MGLHMRTIRPVNENKTITTSCYLLLSKVYEIADVIRHLFDFERPGTSLFLRHNLSSVHSQAPTAPSGKSCRRLNVNHYATKKTVAQSMLDVALLMANSSQLKAVIFVGPHYQFYYPLIVLLSMSIMLQVMVGLLLIFIGK